MALPFAKGALERRLFGNTKKVQAPPKEDPIFDPAKMFGMIGSKAIPPQSTLIPPMPNETITPIGGRTKFLSPNDKIRPLGGGVKFPAPNDKISPIGSPVGTSPVGTTPVSVNKQGRLSKPPTVSQYAAPMDYQAPGAGLTAPNPYNTVNTFKNPNLPPLDPEYQRAISRDPTYARQAALFKALQNQQKNQNELQSSQLNQRYDLNFEDLIQAAQRALKANQESVAARGVMGAPYANVSGDIMKDYQQGQNRTLLTRNQEMQALANEWANFLLSLQIQREQAAADAMDRYRNGQNALTG